jgi:hypothetical protein
MASGLVASADATSVLVRAIVACVVCSLVGYGAGLVLELIAVRVVDRERVRSGVAEPAPEEEQKNKSEERRNAGV